MTTVLQGAVTTSIWLVSGLGALAATVLAVRVGVARRRRRDLTDVNSIWGRSLDPDRSGDYEGFPAVVVFFGSWAVLFLALSVIVALLR